jgi:hypothetical protein
MIKLADSALFDAVDPWQVSFALRWYALAAERLAAGADPTDTAPLSEAVAGRNKAQAMLTLDQQRAAAQALAALKLTLR